MNVERLVKKAQKGNKQALLKLITAQKTDYYRLAYSYMGNEADAKDAMSEMIVILYEKIANLKKRASFYTWSKSILVNACKKMLRERAKVLPINQLEQQKGYVDNQLRIEVEELLALLNEEQRDVMVLKYFHDLDLESIAEMLNIPLGTVKSRVYYSLEKLRKEERGHHNGTI